MPELPEVETIRRGLEKYLVGKQITSIALLYPKIFQGNPEDILNSEIMEVRRFGKGLVIDFANEFSLAVHVKMTGQFIYKGEETQANFHPTLGIVGDLPNKWTHVIFKLKTHNLKHKSNQESQLFYNDIRKFGWLKVVKTEDIPHLPFFKALGPEPFAGLTAAIFDQIVQNASLPIKSLLMDQKKLGGVGNIYANEALFLAKIAPTRLGRTLTETEREKLYLSLLEVLSRGLKYGGASDVNYVNVEGKTGGYQHHFLVYRKQGKKCPQCESSIERTVIGGRGTFFCPKCQQ